LVEQGILVEFKHQGQFRLGVVDRPEGKKNWIVIDDRGQSHTLHPRDMTYTVASGSFTPDDIPEFLATAEAYMDPSSLEVAWEFLMEAGDLVEPASLACLLFSDESPALCYAAYRLLIEDKVYFKRKGDHFEPRSQHRYKNCGCKSNAKPNDSKSGNLSLRKPSKDWLEQPLTGIRQTDPG
jgi:exoribonuclease-2